MHAGGRARGEDGERQYRGGRSGDLASDNSTRSVGRGVRAARACADHHRRRRNAAANAGYCRARPDLVRDRSDTSCLDARRSPGEPFVSALSHPRGASLDHSWMERAGRVWPVSCDGGAASPRDWAADHRAAAFARSCAAAAYPARPPTPGIRGEAAGGRSTAGRTDPTDGIGVTEDRNAPAAGSASFGASLAPGGAAGRAGPVAAARIRAHGFRGAAAGTAR